MKKKCSFCREELKPTDVGGETNDEEILEYVIFQTVQVFRTRDGTKQSFKDYKPQYVCHTCLINGQNGLRLYHHSIRTMCGVGK